MEYKVYVALKEDFRLPIVWIQTTEIKNADTITIRNLDNKNKIYVEAHYIDSAFRNNYNINPKRKKIVKGETVIVISEWYRKKLEVEKFTVTKLPANLKIEKGSYLHKLLAAKIHPDFSLRAAFIISLLSLLLGAVGCLLGFISVLNTNIFGYFIISFISIIGGFCAAIVLVENSLEKR